MAAINDLINQIEDEELKRRITHELDNLLNRKKLNVVDKQLVMGLPLYNNIYEHYKQLRKDNYQLYREDTE